VLTPVELAELESSPLPALERHHLRLLAHALRTLQQIRGGRGGPAPDAAGIDLWLSRQPQLGDDPRFRQAFAAQLAIAAAQLETIAAPERQALDLDLSDLVAWSVRCADVRLGRPGSS
jgi:hypothetical protein